jgi:glucokinase
MEETKNSHFKFLACDVGGTNSRFRIVTRSKADPEFREKHDVIEVGGFLLSKK